MPFGGNDLIMPRFKRGEKKPTKIGGGSGFLVSSDGHLITSNHIVSDYEADYTVILSYEEKYPAKILARDPINDIAILKIEKKGKKFPYLKLGNSDKIELGEEVIAVGNALGEFQDTVSFGIVSGLSRYIQATDQISRYSERLRGLIQTDAAINPGNSGGPLVNMKGEVIGVNTAMAAGAENIGFSIPINYAKKDFKEVKKHGKIIIPFLGIKYILLSKEFAEKNNLPADNGALIVREILGNPPIIKGSAAEKAGLKEFDIILEVNGEKISLRNPLSNIIQKHKVGEEIRLKVLRSKKTLNIKVKLQEKK